ncbi:hypothetical protein JKF63_05356 [Porcisia hertigi]|uniref:Uncharacterized protein n=1 Tax=Porcisia hertigi TaxID=2761500 RepID=A0A836LIS9_9TRYP|nr:hypothetical protein JKF63_05356 [Porcisia hertigi]
MGLCCSNPKHRSVVKLMKGPTHVSDRNGFESKPKHALNIQSVPFDVVVPDGLTPATASANRASGCADAEVTDLSGTLTDLSMHTLREGSVSIERSCAVHDPMNETFHSMSFTNSFSAVDDKAVRHFLQNVERFAEHSSNKGTLLEESIIGTTAGGTRLSSSVRSKASISNATNAIGQEELDYIVAGATLQDRLSRLEEVEAALRQAIEGSFRVNSMFFQLAWFQVVPTLRQRRCPWVASKGSTHHHNTPAHRHSKQQPVIVVYAEGVQFDTPVARAATPLSVAHTSPSLRGDFSPPNGSVNETSIPLGTSWSRPSESLLGNKVQQYELLALTCRDIDPHKSPSALVVTGTWDFLSGRNSAAALNDGRCIFRFLSGSLAAADAETQSVVNAVINLTSFADEVTENNAPKVDVYNAEDAAKYIGIHVKAMYMLPGIMLKDITKSLLSSTEYHRGCQPAENKVQDCETEDTFRLTMTIIRFVFSLTIQFKVSEITDPAVLRSLSVLDGMLPAKVIMLERTKRNVAKVDATAKVRSMLLYYPVNDGLLVNNHTVVLNTSLPNIASKIMNTFGSQGAAQSVQTAKRTREYLLQRFGDSRNKIRQARPHG